MTPADKPATSAQEVAEKVREACAKACDAGCHSTERLRRIGRGNHCPDCWETPKQWCEPCRLASRIRALDLAPLYQKAAPQDDPVVIRADLPCAIPGASASVEITAGGLETIRKALAEKEAGTAPAPTGGETREVNIHSPFNACMFKESCIETERRLRALQTPATGMPEEPQEVSSLRRYAAGSAEWMVVEYIDALKADLAAAPKHKT